MRKRQTMRLLQDITRPGGPPKFLHVESDENQTRFLKGDENST